METIIEVKNIYQFSELSDSAKENARDWFRSGYEFDAECTIDDYKTGAALLGIDIDHIYYSGFSSQGDGACFTGSYSYRKGWKKATKAEFGGGMLKTFLKTGEELQAIQSQYFYRLTADITHTGRYCHENSVTIDVTADDDLYSDLTTAEEGITEALRGLMQEIYSSLESQYDYENSDQVIDENIIDNEYQFDSEGNIHY